MNNKNELRLFCESILSQAGVSPSAPMYEDLLVSVSRRVNVRLSLEMIQLMTAEQAKEFKNKIEHDEDALPRYYAELVLNIPDFTARMAVALSNLQNELVLDIMNALGK